MRAHCLTASCFMPGMIVITAGVKSLIECKSMDPFTYLQRHLQGDWGDVDPQDWQANQCALEHGDRLLSVYRINDELTLWIITEGDRSVTALLLPEEY